MEAINMVTSAIGGAALGVVLTFQLLGDRIDTLEQSVEATPPIAVMDYMSIRSYAHSDEEMQQAMQRMDEQAQQLRRQGFIVLGDASVVEAPSEIRIRYEDVMQ